MNGNCLKAFLLCVLAFMPALAGCEAKADRLHGMNVRFHTHTKGVWTGSVDGVGVKTGGTFCCVKLPEKWRPGLQVEVSWVFDMLVEPEVFNDKNLDRSTLPPPEVKTVMADVQEYHELGTVHAHIMPGDKAKIIVTGWGWGSPFYPLPREEWSPKKMTNLSIFKVVYNIQRFIKSGLTEEDWKWASQWGITRDGKCSDPEYQKWEKERLARIEQHRKSQQEQSE